MHRLSIAFATCAELPNLGTDDRLALEPLAELGIDVMPGIWDAPSIPWGDFDAVVIRSCWDYHLRPGNFRHWLDTLHGAGIALVNPYAALSGNIDKRYLGALAERGILIPDTLFVERGSAPQLTELMASNRLHGRFVIKPTLSAGAHQTWVIESGEAADHQAQFAEVLTSSGAMVQRFVPEVLSVGEWSIVFFDREFSHAARKVPASGDFRVQSEFGGAVLAETPPMKLIDAARAVLDCVDGPLTYARVDGIEVEGEFLLLELELIEPELFLAVDPEAPGRFARAIRRAVGNRKSGDA